MKIGYARVSTKEQNLDMQISDLEKAGCEKIYTEKVSAVKDDRIVLNEVINKYLKSKDTLVIWKLDRISRSLKNLLEIINHLNERNIDLCSLNDPIDTTTANGRLIVNIFASLAEFERDVIRERTIKGLISARARGKIGGRPKGLSKIAEETACMVATLYQDKQLSIASICNRMKISKATLYKYLRYKNIPTFYKKMISNNYK